MCLIKCVSCPVYPKQNSILSGLSATTCIVFLFLFFSTMSRHKPLKWLESRRTHYQLNWMRNDAEKLVSSSIYSGFKSNFFLLISILGRYTSRIISIRNDGNCVEFASKSKKKSSRRQKKLS